MVVERLNLFVQITSHIHPYLLVLYREFRFVWIVFVKGCFWKLSEPRSLLVHQFIPIQLYRHRHPIDIVHKPNTLARRGRLLNYCGISITVNLLQIYFWHLLVIGWGWACFGFGLDARHLLKWRVVEDAHAGRVELLVHSAVSIKVVHFGTASIAIRIDISSNSIVLKLLLRPKMSSAVRMGDYLLLRKRLRSYLLAQSVLQPMILPTPRIKVNHLHR